MATRTRTSRTRLHAVAASAAFAVVGVVGAFVAPAMASASTPTTPVSTIHAADPAPAAVAPAAPAAPTDAQLSPVAIQGEQVRFTPTAEQMSNAKAIVDAAKAMGLPPRAWTIAIATSLQESQLKNIGDLGANNDHDSLGLFQQRPSSGWGTPEEIQNPTYSATAFLNGLVEVSNWETLPLTVAAQKVQVSAYPDHYAKHEAQATDIIKGLYGTGPYAGILS